MLSACTCLVLASLARAYYFETPNAITQGFRPWGAGFTHGAYPQDFSVVGPQLEAVHDSQQPPTGFAVDTQHNLYITYPRNTGPTPSNVVKCTGFNEEQPWPNAQYQNCSQGQDPSTCFINVQNIVLDSIGQFWVVDSGFPAVNPGPDAIYGGAKIMSFTQAGQHKRTYVLPRNVLHDGMNANDVRINNTLGTNGYAFITDESTNSSILAVNLDDGSVVRRLFNSTVVRADPGYVVSTGL